jgi:hypothetical protein
MGISPAMTTNTKLLERPMTVDGNLPKKRSSYSNAKDSTLNPTSKLTIYHQNVRGLGNKMGESETQVLPLLPQVICLTEHHLNNQQIGNISITNPYWVPITAGLDTNLVE